MENMAAKPYRDWVGCVCLPEYGPIVQTPIFLSCSIQEGHIRAEAEQKMEAQNSQRLERG